MKYLLLFPALLLGRTLFAQNFVDLAKVSYTISPNNEFDQPGETTSLKEFAAEVLMPVPLKNGHVIVTGLAYEQSSLKPAPDIARPVKLYSINPRLGISWKHNDKWQGQYLLLPQIASDLKDGINWHDLQMGAIAILSYQKNDDFVYRLGGYYNSALYGPGTFLIAGFYYRSPDQRWLFDFTLPIWGDLNYALSKSYSVGLRYDGMLRSYYLNEPLFTSKDEYIVKLTPDLYSYLQIAVAENYLLQLKIGHSIGRTFRVFNKGDRIDLGFTGLNFGDDRKILSTDFKNGFIFQLRFQYRFYLE